MPNQDDSINSTVSWETGSYKVTPHDTKAQLLTMDGSSLTSNSTVNEIYSFKQLTLSKRSQQANLEPLSMTTAAADPLLVFLIRLSKDSAARCLAHFLLLPINNIIQHKLTT